jgi:Family of unknown function (DUF6364)
MAKLTLSLPDRVVREVRHLAVDEGVSLSRYVARLLEEHVETVGRYRSARDRQLELLHDGLLLGTNGQPRWSRESVHEH